MGKRTGARRPLSTYRGFRDGRVARKEYHESGHKDKVDAVIGRVLEHCRGDEARYQTELRSWIRFTYSPCRECGHTEVPS